MHLLKKLLCLLRRAKFLHFPCVAMIILQEWQKTKQRHKSIIAALRGGELITILNTIQGTLGASLLLTTPNHLDHVNQFIEMQKAKKQKRVVEECLFVKFVDLCTGNKKDERP